MEIPTLLSMELGDGFAVKGFIGKILYHAESGNDPNGVYKSDIDAMTSNVRIYNPGDALTEDYCANRLNICLEKDSNKIKDVSWW